MCKYTWEDYFLQPLGYLDDVDDDDLVPIARDGTAGVGPPAQQRQDGYDRLALRLAYDPWYSKRPKAE